MIMGTYRIFTAIQGVDNALGESYGGTGGYFPLTWSGNSLTWDMESGMGTTDYGMNRTDWTYYVVALMAADE